MAGQGNAAPSSLLAATGSDGSRSTAVVLKSARELLRPKGTLPICFTPVVVRTTEFLVRDRPSGSEATRVLEKREDLVLLDAVWARGSHDGLRGAQPIRAARRREPVAASLYHPGKHCLQVL